MTELGRQRQDWNADELDVIIADYFAMLGDEIARKPYVKAHHRAVLIHRTGRSAGSIERKHQNISAILIELGLPWIWGYKPLPNYQEALFEAIDRFLSTQPAILYQQPDSAVTEFAEPSAVFSDMPLLTVSRQRETLVRLLRKFDPLERDFRNRELGRAGEAFVVNLERKQLSAIDRDDLARKVRWVSIESGDGAGFDVLSYNSDGGERLIEVKTTNGAAHTPFFLTRNEIAVAEEHSKDWYLYRVYLFAQHPRIFTVRPPLGNKLKLDPETWRAQPGA